MGVYMYYIGHYTVDGFYEPISTVDEVDKPRTLDETNLDTLAQLSDDDILQLFLQES